MNAVPEVEYVRVSDDAERETAGFATAVVREIVETKETLPELSLTTT